MDALDLEKEIFEHAPVGLLYTEKRVILRFNRIFADMFGYSLHELDGQSLSLLYPSIDEFDHTGKRWTEKLGTQRYHTDERIMRRKTGELFWCRVRGQSLDPTEPLARAVWSFADLSNERPVTKLTRRERQVAMLLVEGLTAKEIARRLEISPRTVDVHKNRLLLKFGARNSIELVRSLTTDPR